MPGTMWSLKRSIKSSFGLGGVVELRIDLQKKKKPGRLADDNLPGFFYAACLMTLPVKYRPEPSGSMAATWRSVAKPSALSPRMTIQVVSISQGLNPWRADFGKA